MKYLYLDTETGGLDPSYALLTIGLVAHDDEQGILGTAHIKVSPVGFMVDDKALAINKIDMAEHLTHALPRQEAAEQVSAFIRKHFGFGWKNKPFVVGHNVSFDRGFMDKLFKDCKLELPYSYRALDTMGVALFMYDLGIYGDASNLKLDFLIERYGIEIAAADRHTSLGDALATRSAHLAMRQEVDAFYAFKYNRPHKEHSC